MSIGGRSSIGKYQLARQVGVGASCALWDAVDPGDQTRYVLKVLQSEHRSNKEMINQLKNEFAAGKDIKHPHVIRVYEYNVYRDTPYMVMESFRSANLKQIMRDKPEWVAEHAQSILEQAAEALAEVHRHGWVHRDIKPDNLLVNEEGDVRLIDFSLARKEKKGLGKLLSGKSKVQGTRSYISPEQIRGEPADPRSDIYSFGCMMFEMIAGKPPFSGISSDDLLTKHLRSRPPSVLTSNENATPEVADLIAKMMAKSAEDRPQTMDDFLKEFRPIRVYKRTLPPTAPASAN